MSIERYNQKRDFAVTPEPAGKVHSSGKAGHLRFVVQKHEASHLHYDFRLELSGVLLSWAVPKGPSLNPEDKRLAMHVEDHPMDYRRFEGIIPKGNYGGGTVMVWDEGIYYAERGLSKTDNHKRLEEGYRKGKLTFFMEGSKLHGEFSLVRMRGKSTEDKAWLLIKADDAGANRDSDIRDMNKSALSGRSMEEIAANADAAVWTSKGASTRSSKVSAKKAEAPATKTARAASKTAAKKPANTSSAGKRSAPAAAAKEAPADKIASKKSAVKKTPAGQTAVKKPPQKNAAVKKASTRKTPPTKASASKTTAKKPSAGRKAPAKKSAGLADEALAFGGRPSTMPAIGGPQLATLVDAPFDREGWLFEIKWDGYRVLGFHPPHDGVSLLSRNGLSFDNRFASIHAALATLPYPAIVDGEVVVLDSAGKSSFAQLQQQEVSGAALVYYLFDLLWVDGVDIRELALTDRKQLLRRLLENCDSHLQYSDHVETRGTDFFAVAKQNQLEGIIAKDGSAAYYSRRTRHWLKIKIEQRQEFLIAGYTAPRRSRSDIGSLVLAYYERKNGKPTGRLRFAGHVGTGLDTQTRAQLKKRLDERVRKTPAFDAKVATNEPATWVEPELVCEVRFTEKTADCQLRHPVFIALRTDKPPEEIFWDVAENTEAAVPQSSETQK